MSLEDFKQKFAFKPELAYQIGVEREFFIADKNGCLAPRAESVLAKLQNPLPDAGSFCYELSACQIESQSVPCSDEKSLRAAQLKLNAELDRVLTKLQLQKLYLEFAPADMPLDVFPDPKGRYGKMAKKLPDEILLAALRVIASHFHIGMPDHDTALSVYNRAIKHSAELCRMGDNSSGKRLEAYRQVTDQCDPRPYSSWEDFYEYAKQNSFTDNPRDCWSLIRLTIHGTIEFRNFGVTDSLDDIVAWANYCRSICL